MGDGRCKTDFGRWKLPSSTVSICRKTPSRGTCCGFLPPHVGVLLFNMFALKLGVVFIGVTGVNIAQNGASLVPKSWSYADRCTAGSSMRHIDFLVAVTSLYSSSSPVCSGTFPFVAVFARSPQDTDTIYRLYVTWRDHLDLFTVFCFTFLWHWILDLASIIAFFVVAYQRDVHHSSEVCLERGLEPGCTVPVHRMFVTVTVGYVCSRSSRSVCLRFSIYPQMHLKRALRNVQLPPYPSPHSSSSTQTKFSPNFLFRSTPEFGN